ncbi:MAG: FAD-dependent oxidoreductase [Candidatus Dormibacteria bacterium]
MAKPAILTVDDDPGVSQAIARDLRRQYGADYQIMRSTSGAEALTVLTELALKQRTVALIAADQRMPEMTGIEFLAKARANAPDAKLVLLTAYADSDAAIRAINDIGLDYYLQKPWDPPEERLYPVLDGLLDDWRQGHRDDADVCVVGDRWSLPAFEIKTFLARNHVPYRWLDIERDDEAGRLRDLAQAATGDLPLVLIPDGATLRAPSTLEVATALGLQTAPKQPLYDLCIVGGGPAGLAAAVYATSEGLATVLVERQAPGGQAGLSAAIENYLGFPRGVSGDELAQRAVAQARRFGTEMVIARDVVAFESRGPVRAITFADSTAIEARSLIVATGVSYRMLEAPGLNDLTGRGVFYGASASDARTVQGEDVYIVGGANSAGQATLNMAKFARRVVMLVRGDSLSETMSQYLIDRILATDNIEVRANVEVTAARGDGHLEAVTVSHRTQGSQEEVAANWLFIFIGASPRTGWLGADVARDRNGFIVTGPDLLGRTEDPRWLLERPPLLLESTVPGLFAAGDVRLESMKRVASAVGEGAMAVSLVHRYLAMV